MFNMIEFLKKCWAIIFILVVSFILPFNVEAKGYNWDIMDKNFDEAEFISGDDVTFDNEYISVGDQEFEVYNVDKSRNFEYYIIDSIDSKGNIKYKKYDFSKAAKSVWYPDGYVFRGYSHSGSIIDVSGKSLLESFISCQKDNIYKEYESSCRIVLPAINGKISRWKFDSKKYSNKKEIDVCRYKNYPFSLYAPCDKTADEPENTYIGTYEFYTSYVYKFYEVSDEKPQLKVMCDNNKLTAGQTTKCKANISYKYWLSNILFNITSDKLKISNFKVGDDDWDWGNTWTPKEIDNGYSMDFAFGHHINPFEYNPVIATFDVSSDSDVNNVLASLRRTNFRYIDRLGENTLSDASFDVDLENKKDNIVNKDNISNPSTFRDNYYLVIGILIVGLICFIQMKSKAKSK